MTPELFYHEINKLDWEDRKQFIKPRIGFKRADGDNLEIDNRDNEKLNTLN